MADPNTTATQAITRARREAAATGRLGQLIGELRTLSSGASIDHARRVRDRYARALGYPVGVGGDVLIDLLVSVEAATLRMDQIDDLIVGLATGDKRLARLAARQ